MTNVTKGLRGDASLIYLTPFGFDPSHVISVIVEKGIKDKDRIVLVIPEVNEEDERFIRGKQEVENTIDRISDANIDILKVDHKDFEESVLKISKFISEEKGPFCLNASQAAREILIATLMAALFQRNKFEDFVIFSDVDRRNLKNAELPFPVQLSEKEKKIVKKVRRGITVSELAEALNIDNSTASRKINTLEEKNILKTKKQGRRKKLKLTFTGKIYRSF